MTHRLKYQVDESVCKHCNGQNSRRKRPDSSRSLFVSTQNLCAREIQTVYSESKTRDATCRPRRLSRRLLLYFAREKVDELFASAKVKPVSFRERVTQTRRGEADSPKDNRSLGKTRLPGHNPFYSGSPGPPA